MDNISGTMEKYFSKYDSNLKQACLLYYSIIKNEKLIVESIKLFFTNFLVRGYTYKKFISSMNETFFGSESALSIENERLYILGDFYVPICLLDIGQLMIIFNLTLTKKLQILKTGDDVIISNSLVLPLKEECRKYLSDMTKKYFFEVVVKEETKKRDDNEYIQALIYEKIVDLWKN